VPKNIKFGVFFPCYTFRAEKQAPHLFNKLKQTVQECERIGYHSVWLDDHLMLNNTPILEGWTTLSALATATTTIRLGTMVTCNSFRNPALLAKMSATVDNISNGRLELGLGAGIQQKEHEAYGFKFPTTTQRIERLDEAAEIIKKMWTEQKTSYNGKHYHVTEAVCQPKPVQNPHPPLIIAGAGEKRTLHVTAKHADRLDFGYLPTLEEYNHKLDVLKKHCKTVNRPFSDIERSCWPTGQIFVGKNKTELDKKVKQQLPESISLKDFVKTSFVGSPEQCIKMLQPYVDLGVTQFMLFFGDMPDLDGLRLFAKTVLKEFN
jgi:F420-dependent oxidoreductase-like protein